MPSRQGLVDDGALHGPAVLARRFGTKAVMAEPALQLLVRIMVFPAPAARRIGAGSIPETPHQAPCFRKLVAHPGRHHRVAARYGEPRQGIGQRPAEPLGIGDDLARLGRAGGIRQSPHHGRRPLPRNSALAPASLPKDLVQGTVLAGGVRRTQPVPSGEQVRLGLRQCLALVLEDLQRNAGVEFGIVHATALEPGVLVVLDECVIGIAREGEWAESQRVHHRQLQQPEVRLGGCQMG